MADKLSFELVSPERLLSSLEADMVVLPAEDGDMGVLPEHAPVVTLLRPGVIDVYQGNNVDERVFVEGGFAEVNPKGLIVLAEAAKPLKEVKPEDARQRLQNAKEDLGEAKDDAERERLEREVLISERLVEAAEAKQA